MISVGPGSRGFWPCRPLATTPKAPRPDERALDVGGLSLQSPQVVVAAQPRAAGAGLSTSKLTRPESERGPRGVSARAETQRMRG